MAIVQMVPPDDGSRNTLTFSGRTYTSTPRSPIPVQSFDVGAMETNGWYRSVGGGIGGGGPYRGSFTVAQLPTGNDKDTAYALNGLKIGESSGAGTGVLVYFSLTKWRVISTDAPVLS